MSCELYSKKAVCLLLPELLEPLLSYVGPARLTCRWVPKPTGTPALPAVCPPASPVTWLRLGSGKCALLDSCLLVVARGEMHYAQWRNAVVVCSYSDEAAVCMAAFDTGQLSKCTSVSTAHSYGTCVGHSKPCSLQSGFFPALHLPVVECFAFSSPCFVLRMAPSGCGPQP